MDSEGKIQSDCVKWFKNEGYPDLKHLYFMIHNDGKKSIVSASLDIARGLTAGIPDTFLSVARRGFNGLYIEFKCKGEVMSKRQLQIKQELERQGFMVAVIDNLSDFQNLINFYLYEDRN